MATPFIKKMYNALRRYDHDPAVGMRLVRQNVRTEDDLLAKIKWPHCNRDAALVAALLDIDRAIPLIVAWLQRRTAGYGNGAIPYLGSFRSPQVVTVLLYTLRHNMEVWKADSAVTQLWFRQLEGDYSMLPMLYHLFWKPHTHIQLREYLAEALLMSPYFDTLMTRIVKTTDVNAVMSVLFALQANPNPKQIPYISALCNDTRRSPYGHAKTIGELATAQLDNQQMITRLWATYNIQHDVFGPPILTLRPQPHR